MNKEPDFSKLADCKIAIWGLGLIGGSLAYALSGKCASLIGVDPDPHTVELATASNIFNSVSQRPKAVLSEANLIILAAPVCAILKQLEALPGLHPGPCVVLDLGSTKRQIVEAMTALPSKFSPVGGHPMCGTEHSSYRHADPSLFLGASFALINLPNTSPHALALAEACVRQIGATPLWLDAETHDRWAAMTSHMPYLIANAVAASVSLDAAPLAGSGFRSTSRLAAASPAMMLDILLTNQDYLLDAVKDFQVNLENLAEIIRRGDHAALEKELQQSRNARNALLTRGKA